MDITQVTQMISNVGFPIAMFNSILLHDKAR